MRTFSPTADRAHAPVDAGGRMGEPAALERCAACGTESPGPYCPACGQRIDQPRLTLPSLLRAALQRLLDLDRGLWYTVRRLTLRPEEVIHDYVAGRRVVYVHPLTYLVVAVAAFAFGFHLLGGVGGADNRVFMAPAVFFLAGASRLVFWRAGLNLAEHLVLSLYLCAHVVLWLTVTMVPAALLSVSAARMLTLGALLVAFAYVVWSYSRVFPRRPVLAATGGALVVALGLASWAATLVLVVRLLSGR